MREHASGSGTMTGMRRAILLAGLLMGNQVSIMAHPTPDIPVRSFFGEGRSMKVEVEIDPRCFSEDPDLVPYVTLRELRAMTEAQREEIRAQAKRLILDSVEFRFGQAGAVEPQFELDFTTLGGGSLEENEDPVMVCANWVTELGKTQPTYFIRARPVGVFSVQFLNYFEGEPLQRFAVLFPGELSFPLELETLAEMPLATPEERAAAAEAARVAVTEGHES